MARDFDNANDGLVVNVAAFTGYPYTLACWFNCDTEGAGGGAQELIWVGDKDTTNSRTFLRYLSGSGFKKIDAAVFTGTWGEAITATDSAPLNQWNHAVGVFTNATSRAAYVNGGNKATNATNLTPTGHDRTAIGYSPIVGSEGSWFGGRIAEAAIWNIALSDAEVAALYYSNPLRVRPESLVAYWPLWGSNSPEPNIVGSSSLNLSLTDAPAAAVHPPVSPLLGIWGGGISYSIYHAAGFSSPVPPLYYALNKSLVQAGVFSIMGLWKGPSAAVPAVGVGPQWKRWRYWHRTWT